MNDFGSKELVQERNKNIILLNALKKIAGSAQWSKPLGNGQKIFYTYSMTTIDVAKRALEEFEK